MGSMSGMTEGVLLMILFVVLATAVLVPLNSTYGKDYSIGLDTSAISDFESATQTAYDSTTGEVETTGDGLTLSSGWRMGKAIFSTAWGFVSGSWISTIINGMLGVDGEAGSTVATIIRILFLLVLIGAVIKLFFKVGY